MTFVVRNQQHYSSNETIYSISRRVISTAQLDQKFNEQNNLSTNTNTMRMDEERFQFYKQSVLSVLSSNEFLAVQNVLKSKEIWDSDTFLMLQEWLLSDKRILEASLILKHWAKLKKYWVLSSLRKKDELDENAYESSLYASIFRAQRRMFQSKLLHSNIYNTSFNDIDSFPTSFFPIADLIFHQLASHCHEKNEYSSLLILMVKIKECGIVPNKSTIRALLGLMNDLPSLDRESFIVLEELVIFSDLKHNSSELGFGSLDEKSKFEAYYRILEYYCDTWNLPEALSMFVRMQQSSSVKLESHHYVMILAMLAETGHLRKDAPSIEGLDGIYNNSAGPNLFNEIVAEMANTVDEIDPSCAVRLYKSFVMGFNDYPIHFYRPGHEMIDTIENVPISRCAAKRDELVACRVWLDKSTGKCPITETQQHIMPLSSNQRKIIHDDLFKLAKEEYNNSPDKKHKDSSDRALIELQKFSQWLAKKKDVSYTAIIDGANAAFYKHHLNNGEFNYRQLKFVVDALEAEDYKALVILPSKYVKPGFILSDGRRQRLNEEDLEIMNDFVSSRNLYVVPARCHDDLYCMLATVVQQKSKAQQYEDSFPVLVTNDRMNDHALEKIDPSLFQKWYDLNILMYRINHLGETSDAKRIQFFQPKRRAIQASEKDDAKIWHFPLKNRHERFVIRIPVLI